jgi:alkanesulfonate monooxygenase SsuD/methylene tetrahydromethanopterin reductase-like flavin-dependent oxidoreductase (luciferase family)
LQQELGSKGLVVMSVHLLTPIDKEEGLDKAKRKAETFLAKLDPSPMIHVWLDESDDLWMKKFGINGYPAQFVFNRSNRVEKKFAPEDEDSKAVEALVRKLVVGA